MKVICIDENFKQSAAVQGKPHPKCGEICTVVNTFYRGNRAWYELEEYNSDHLFDVRKFAILSDIDETQLIANYESPGRL